MRDKRYERIGIGALLMLVFHVSCLASTNLPPSHASCLTAHSSNHSSSTSHASCLIPHISVTNHAGRVICGEFGGVTNNAFILSGRVYPLSVLPKSEILRLKRLAGCDVRTAKERRRDRARAMHLERIRLREEAGEIDKETADRLRAQISRAATRSPKGAAPEK